MALARTSKPRVLSPEGEGQEEGMGKRQGGEAARSAVLVARRGGPAKGVADESMKGRGDEAGRRGNGVAGRPGIVSVAW